MKDLPWWLPFLVAGSGLLTGLFAAVVGWRAKVREETWTSWEATVARMESDGDGGDWPILAYRSPVGEAREFRPSQRKPEWVVGQRVAIRVDPRDPTSAEVSGIRNPLPFVFMLSAVSELVIAVGLYVAMRS